MKNSTVKIPLKLQVLLDEKSSDRFNFKYKKNDRKQKRKEAKIQKKMRKNQRQKSRDFDACRGDLANGSEMVNVREIPSDKSVKVARDVNSDKSVKVVNQLEKLKKSNPSFYSLLKNTNLIKNDSLNDEIEGYAKKLDLKNGKLNKTFEMDGLDYLLTGEDGDFIYNPSTGKDDIITSDMERERYSGDDGVCDKYEILEDDVMVSDYSDGVCDIPVNDEDYEDLLEESDDEDNEDLLEESDDDVILSKDSDGINNISVDSDVDHGQVGNDCEKENTDIVKDGEKSILNGKYIPPHARRDAPSKLKRQLQGLINRLNDSNMESIIHGVMNSMGGNSRNEMTTLLTELLLKSIEDGRLTTEFASTTASFISILFNLIGNFITKKGMEFGAHFIQEIIKQILHVENSKRCLNCVTLLAFLYNYNVISCILVYDLIRESIKSLNELNVEIILLLVKISGNQLRSDDPSALKDIVLLLQSSRQETTTLRFKFMVETIIDIKNNKRPSTIPKQKKMINSIIQKHATRTIEALGVSLADIKNVKENGKWWLVGSAWKGAVPADSTIAQSQTSQLYQLAKSQKMNTEIRKQIFIILMSSQDYIEAFEKLLKLNLSEKQQRDIIRVIFHCCLGEKVYNPYYSYLAKELCANNHSYKITIQYTIWDLFTEMNNQQDPEYIYKVSNLGKLYADLILMGSINLSILKKLNFTRINTYQQLFLKVFLKKYLESCHDLDAWKSLQKMDELYDLKSGLLLVIKTWFGKKTIETMGFSHPSKILSKIKLLKTNLE
jgi:nucleolar MIF4G domain-containing protein 1